MEHKMIINLTQHQASAEQIAECVADLPPEQREALSELLTFGDCPDAEEISDRAEDIAELACYNGLGGDDGDSPLIRRAMIGGALWLMAPLAEALRARRIEPIFAFSVRDTLEQPQPDGSVRKVAVFRHAGWVPAL
jgi:hypothetical protein